MSLLMHTVKTSKPISRIIVRNKSDKVCGEVSMMLGSGQSLTVLRLHPAQLPKDIICIYYYVGQILAPLHDIHIYLH